MSELKTPQPIDSTFGVGDYVADVTPHANIHNDFPIGGTWAYWRKITLVLFVFFCDPKILLASQVQTTELIFMLSSSCEYLPEN